MGKNLEISLLLDFYGDMLTDKQREVVECYYNEDLSLAEIAEELGVSRQGVFDNIARAESRMLKMEEKTGFVRRSLHSRKVAQTIRSVLEELNSNPDPAVRQAARRISDAVMSIEE